MQIIDAQMHPPEALSIRPDEVVNEDALTTELALMSMNAAGVDACVFAPTRTDVGQIDWPLQAIERHPDKFASVMVIPSDLENMGEEVGRMLDHPGIVGIRIVEPGQTNMPGIEFLNLGDGNAKLREGAWEPAFAECVKRGAPAQLFFSTMLEEAEPFLRSHPDLQVILIHFGLFRSLPGNRFREGDPWRQLPLLLDLAKFDNVVVQLSQGHGLSKEDYPFSDLWPPLHQMFDAYGAERLMWGSDWTFNRSIFNYADWVHFFRETTEISQSEKEQIFSGTLRSVYHWPPS